MSYQRTQTIAPAVAAAASVHAAITLTDENQTVTTAITQPDVPRCITFTGNQASVRGWASVSGTDWNGDAAAASVELSGTATVRTGQAFATIDLITLPSLEDAGETVTVGCADVFALEGDVTASTDVQTQERKAIGGAFTSEAVGTVDTLYNTVAVAIVAGDEIRWVFLSVTVPGATLCSLVQVKSRGHIDTTESDEQIEDLIAEALRRFNIAGGREYMPWVVETRTFDLDRYLVQMDGCDLRQATSVILHPDDVSEAVTLVEGTDYVLCTERLTNTAGIIRLSESLSLSSTRALAFGKARIQITGYWGIWSDLSEVAADVNQAAIAFVLANLDRAAESVAGFNPGSAHGSLPALGSSWDIPTVAYRKLQPYNRNVGCV